MCFFKDFIKNPQTTIALTFWTHIISGIDGVFNLMIDPFVIISDVKGNVKFKKLKKPL